MASAANEVKTSDKLIAVTGASGYIAGHIIPLLLQKGYKVRGVVRDLSKRSKYEHLLRLPGASDAGRLEFVQADLQDNKYGEILKGCYGLIHTASPYIYEAADAERDIVAPAIAGTTSAINAAIAAGVKRVVVTSSGGAVLHFPVEPNYAFTAKDWNNWSSVQNNPYFFSKRQAEKAAWDLYEQNKDRFELVVVNPLYVLGPPLTAELNTSLKLVKEWLVGENKNVRPGRIGLVDVRDVATAHVIALEHPDAKGQRLLCAAETPLWKDVTDKMKQQFPAFPVTLDSTSPVVPAWSVDTTPLKQLGMPAFRSLDTMVKDTVEAFVQLGVVKVPSA